MPFITPLPAEVRNWLAQNTHPGLLLDRYVPSWDRQADAGKFSERVQRPAVEKAAELSQQPPPGLDWSALAAKWREMLRTLQAELFDLETIAPLTLHLSRASALENAGICLHPLYGFVYLPGTGLKGMARAYAETVWLQEAEQQRDVTAAWRKIEAVFGWAPDSDKDKPWKPKGIPPREKGDKEHTGDIVFHDAWPKSWPKLICDIVNNHHPRYYQEGEPPGDWENPVPVYFLAVPAGQSFLFALSRRRADVGEDLLRLAKRWLLGALCHEGAGAKTAAGYGRFRQVAETPVLRSPARETFEATLTLATPAFLAGAGQRAEDCDLRPATLRGLLRWWWRTMHAGYVDVATLQRLEAALWGDTAAGGAIRIGIVPLMKVAPKLYVKQQEARAHGLPKPPNNKTTQGLWYHSYGMHDGGKQRYYVPEGTRWQVTFSVRKAHFVRHDVRGRPVQGSERTINKAIVLDQAKAALWWLCMVGGVGAKSRKGFGNFLLPPELADFEGGRFVSKGRELRTACGLPDDGFLPERAEGPALRQMVDLGRKVQPEGSGWLQLVIPVDNIWQAIDATGMAAQRFAQQYKHRREKCALGLPRNIRQPVQGHFRPGPGVTNRHASPVHYHLHQEDKQYILRIAAFPAARLPDLNQSEQMLEQLLRHFLDTFA